MTIKNFPHFVTRLKNACGIFVSVDNLKLFKDFLPHQIMKNFLFLKDMITVLEC